MDPTSEFLQNFIGAFTLSQQACISRRYSFKSIISHKYEESTYIYITISHTKTEHIHNTEDYLLHLYNIIREPTAEESAVHAQSPTTAVIFLRLGAGISGKYSIKVSHHKKLR